MNEDPGASTEAPSAIPAEDQHRTLTHARPNEDQSRAIADPALCAASGWKGVSVIPIAQRLGGSAATRYGYVSAGRWRCRRPGRHSCD